MSNDVQRIERIGEELNLKATARVQVLIEISAPDYWSEDATFAQVEREARRYALDLIERLRTRGIVAPIDGMKPDLLPAKIVGAPTVLCVMQERKDR